MLSAHDHEAGAARDRHQPRGQETTRSFPSPGDPHEVAIDVLWVAGRRERARRCCRLHHDHEADDDRERHQRIEMRKVGGREREARQAGRHVAEHGYSVFLQIESHHRHGRRHQPDQGARNARAPSFAGECDRQDAEPERERQRIGLTEMLHEGCHAIMDGAADARQAQNGRRLRQHDVDGDSGQKAGDDGPRQEIGNPAKPHDAAGDQDHADQERQRTRQPGIFRRPRGGEQRQAAGEYGRDGGIRPDRDQPARSESRERERAGHEGEEADLRREAAQPRGRHLLRDCDGGERQPGRQVTVKVRGGQAAQRAEQRPGRPRHRPFVGASRGHHVAPSAASIGRERPLNRSWRPTV